MTIAVEGEGNIGMACCNRFRFRFRFSFQPWGDIWVHVGLKECIFGVFEWWVCFAMEIQ